MVTYPSTHGVFEEDILEIIRIIHDNGGQVYMDGANMNAQVGLTNPGLIGADVCHLNLHRLLPSLTAAAAPGKGLLRWPATWLLSCQNMSWSKRAATKALQPWPLRRTAVH